MRVGITGHTNLTPETAGHVAAELRTLLAATDPPLVGVTCLALGADQLFADVALALGGRIEVILPSVDYRDAKVPPSDVAHFDALVAQASDVRTMPFTTADRNAYRAANTAMIAAVDRLIAVWDGVPGGKKGSTGEAVADAIALGLPVTVVWPPGARRAS